MPSRVLASLVPASNVFDITRVRAGPTCAAAARGTGAANVHHRSMRCWRDAGGERPGGRVTASDFKNLHPQNKGAGMTLNLQGSEGPCWCSRRLAVKRGPTWSSCENFRTRRPRRKLGIDYERRAQRSTRGTVYGQYLGFRTRDGPYYSGSGASIQIAQGMGAG